MFDVKEAAKNVVINACAVCEHRHPAGCNYCDLDHTFNKPDDPWWPRRSDVKAINIASGEDAHAFG